MSYFAPVVSLGMMERLHELGALPPYQLLLAHEVLREREAWTRFYGERLDSGVQDFVIMDNSLIELGHPLPNDQLIIAVDLVGADVLVLPDRLADCNWTVTASKAAAKVLAKPLEKLSCQMLGVVQGTTWTEYEHCAAKLVEVGVTMLSIPRITVKMLGSRFYITQQLTEAYPDITFHLLGFSDNLVDDLATAALCRVMGIDSAEPIRKGLLGASMLEEVILDRRQPSWLELPGSDLTEQAVENVVQMTRWLENGPSHLATNPF